MSHSELATSYAALILADDEIEVTVRYPWFLKLLFLADTTKSLTNSKP